MTEGESEDTVDRHTREIQGERVHDFPIIFKERTVFAIWAVRIFWKRYR